MSDTFGAIFQALRQIMVNNSQGYTVLHDEPGKYHLQSSRLNKNKQPIGFGAVEIKKNYVSYHLVAVYFAPVLLDKMSDELRKRMQGKGCFNFKSVDEQLFEELAELTVSCRNAFSILAFE